MTIPTPSDHSGPPADGGADIWQAFADAQARHLAAPSFATASRLLSALRAACRSLGFTDEQIEAQVADTRARIVKSGRVA